MKKSKIIVKESLLDAIANSNLLEDFEKIDYFKYVWYLTPSEQSQFEALV